MLQKKTYMSFGNWLGDPTKYNELESQYFDWHSFDYDVKSIFLYSNDSPSKHLQLMSIILSTKVEFIDL